LPAHVAEPERHAHPILFLILYLPFGISGGYVIVTLAYLLTQSGVSVLAVSGLIALMLFPQTWKVLWAPIVDTTLTAKRWYLISTVGIGLFLLATAFVPAQESSMWLLDVLVFLASVTSTVSAMATESLMAHGTSDHQKGRAGGWSQAGNLGGAGLGGGAGLWMAQHVAPWSAGAALGIFCLLCSGALWFLVEQPRTNVATRYVDNIVGIGKDVWEVARSRAGYLTLVLFFLPIGTGAASNLWAAVSGDWRATADTVALVNGVLGGFISMAGCLVAGYLCDVMDRKTGYAAFSILMTAVAVAMAIAPRTPEMFVVFTCLYAFVTGFCYAAFTAVTLETIGKGAAATKYNLLACLSNLPIMYMTLIEGQAQTRWGSGGMLYTEAVLGIAGVVLFGAIALATRRRVATVAA
jgi:PAT family beta-lactamase induction signal transducer AmpG